MTAVAITLSCARKTVAREEAIRQCLILEGSPEYRPFIRCLVDRFGWTPDSALAYAADTVRQIEIARAAEQRRVEDSVNAELARRAEADAAERRTREAEAAAEHRLFEEARLSGIWVSSDSTGLYYRGSCAEARKIHGADRREWTTGEPTFAGFKHSTAPGC
jgi:hypothetical protein